MDWIHVFVYEITTICSEKWEKSSWNRSVNKCRKKKSAFCVYKGPGWAPYDLCGPKI